MLGWVALGVGLFFIGRELVKGIGGLGPTKLDAPVQFPPGAIPPGNHGTGHVTHETPPGSSRPWVVASFPLSKGAGFTDMLVVAVAEDDPRYFVNLRIESTGERKELRLVTPPDAGPSEANEIRALWGLPSR